MDRIAKAVVAALVAFGAMFETASAMGSLGGEAVTTQEWIKIAVATAIAGVAVWATPNTPPNPPTS
jgi:Sec-independent protein secretion pathway component TatC